MSREVHDLTLPSLFMYGNVMEEGLHGGGIHGGKVGVYMFP